MRRLWLYHDVMASPHFRFVQKEPSVDGSFDVCYIYVFFVEFIDVRTRKPCRLKYVARAEKLGEVYAVKFYASRDRKSRHDKYSLAHKQLGVGAVLSIFNICLDIVVITMQADPDCSFVFKGAEAYDPNTQKWEDERENQRFRIYRSYLSKKVGSKVFAHFHYPENSIYLLVRRDGENVDDKKRRLMEMLKSRFGML